MNKEVWIHIGPPKTGTSAIQRWLVNNREGLLKRGIYYPQHSVGANGISSGHIHSVLSAYDGGYKPDATKIEKLKQEFEDSKCSCLLLSSEYFFSYVEQLCEHFPKARIIAYVRCPIETFESSYNQLVKRHWETDLLCFSKNLHTTTLDRLSAAASACKRNRFYFRAYLPIEITEFNLIEDFLSQLGVDTAVPVKRTNSSYTYEALITKRWLNKFKFAELDHRIDEAFQVIEDGLTRYSLLPQDRQIRHVQQCINTLRIFHTRHQIKNAHQLLESIEQRGRLETVTQDITALQLETISSLLVCQNEELYLELCRNLKSHALAESEAENIAIFCQYQEAPVCSIFSWIWKWLK